MDEFNIINISLFFDKFIRNEYDFRRDKIKMMQIRGFIRRTSIDGYPAEYII